MTSVLYADLKLMKIFHKKLENYKKKNRKYLTENQLSLNDDKTEMFFFTNRTNSDPEFTFKSEVIKPAQVFRYLGEPLIQT